MSIFPGKFIVIGSLTLEDGTPYQRNCFCEKRIDACDVAALLSSQGFLTSIVPADNMDFCPHCRRLVVGKWITHNEEVLRVCPRCLSEVEWDVYDGS